MRRFCGNGSDKQNESKGSERTVASGVDTTVLSDLNCCTLSGVKRLLAEIQEIECCFL